MKFYDCATAPSPRRVRIFMAEKNIEIETIQVDLASGEHFSEAFKAINPLSQVPVLELDDGTHLSQIMAICRYLEEIYPDIPLFGRDPVERARVDSINDQLQANGMVAVMEAFRNALAAYDGIDAAKLRAHLIYFLDQIIPIAQSCGVKMVIHPDDPPYSILGLPRVVSTASDIQALFSAVRRGDLVAVRAQLAEGANVNAQNTNGTTALMVAGEDGAGWFGQPVLAEYSAWVIDRHSGGAWGVGPAVL